MITVNGKDISFDRFPNKECGFTIDQSKLKRALNKEDAINNIVFKFEDNSSLIELLFVKKEIDCYAPGAFSLLVIAYMPYSRLDRVENDVAFTLKHVAELINSLKFTKVMILEPHSDVTCALIDNSIKVKFTELLFNEAVSSGNIEFDPEVDAVCFPDAGAQKNYGKMGDYNTLIGMKERDFKTGWILNLDILEPKGYSVKGKNVVIVDDLCSKGGTFIMTAQELRKLGAKTITLVITHCEDTIFNGDILKTDLIDYVVTSNTIVDKSKMESFEKVFIVDFNEYL